MTTLLLCVVLLALCRLWHGEKCKGCRKQTERDISVEKAAVKDLLRILEQRRATRRTRGARR